jgi:hypothetical protein
VNDTLLGFAIGVWTTIAVYWMGRMSVVLRDAIRRRDNGTY